MPTEAKRETIAELRAELANHRTMIVSEYRGLTVKEIAEIRRALRKQDVTYRVVKNRLMRIAATEPAQELGRDAKSTAQTLSAHVLGEIDRLTTDGGVPDAGPAQAITRRDPPLR